MTTTTAVRERLQGVLDLAVASDEWDLAPTLAILLDGPDGEVLIEPIPLPNEMWDSVSPHQVVIAAGKSFAAMHEAIGWTPFLDDTVTLRGVVLFSEGWAVSEHSREAAEALQAWMAAGHRLSEHELAVEVKMVSAVLVDDSLVMLTYARNQTPFPEGEATEGRIPDSLRELLDVLKSLVPA